MSDKVKDSSDYGAYFTQLYNMADDDLDAFEYRLLGHYKRRGTCTESIETTAKFTQMDIKTVRAVRKKLEKKGYITVSGRTGRGLCITLVDRMAENVNRYANRKTDQPKTDDQIDRKRMIRSTENNPSDLPNLVPKEEQEEPKEEKQYIALRAENEALHKRVDDLLKELEELRKLVQATIAPTPEKIPEPPKSSAKKVPVCLPETALTKVMHETTPPEIRPVKCHYGKHASSAKAVYNAGYTAEQVRDFVEWKYAHDPWMWTGDNESPIVMTMNMIEKQINASMPAIKRWIAAGKPQLKVGTNGHNATAPAHKPNYGF